MPTWTQRWGGNVDGGYLRLGTRGWQTTLPNDDDRYALYNWLNQDLTAAQNKALRITVHHHNFNMFVPDGNTVATARSLFSGKNVNYMISGHAHTYSTGTDSSGIPFLVTGEANKSNPGFTLIHVNGNQITHQHMRADNLNLNVTYNTPNDGSVSQGIATISCSGYNLPFIRLKFRLLNTYSSYVEKDAATGAVLQSYSHQFEDYTVVYVETSINNGATRNILVEPQAGGELVNLSEGKPAISNGTLSGYGEEKANNGIAAFGDGWSSTSTTNPWWQVDLGSPAIIKRIELIDRPDIDQITTRRNFAIQASNDPNFSSYTTLASIGSTPFPDDTTWSADVTNPNKFRYIRLYKTSNEYMFISELKVWGY